ncbi:MAG TPA: hypothetical protein VKS79_08575 [Gemmataceae bacterium]|nr:hypothetical protein [Gemmataceae bacterium]
MVKRLMVVALVMGVTAAFTLPAQALGRRGGCGACGDCASPCGMTAGCGVSVSYVDRQITCYRPVMKESVVNVTVQQPVYTKQTVPQTTYECHTSMVPYTYTVLEQHVEKVTKPVTTYTCQTTMVPYTYTVLEQHVEKVTKPVTTYKCEVVQVPYTFTVMVPHVTPTQRMVTTYRTEMQPVTVQVPVTRVVRVPVYNPCTCCCQVCCYPVTEVVTCTRMVCRSIPVQQMVTVNVCTYTPEQRQGVRCENKVTPITTMVTCDVVRCVPVPRQGMRPVTTSVPHTTNVTCDVVRCVPVPKQGMRPVTTTVPVTKPVEITVCSYQPKLVPQRVMTCTMEAYTTTVKIPVYNCGGCGGCGPAGSPPSAPMGAPPSGPKSGPIGG